MGKRHREVQVQDRIVFLKRGSEIHCQTLLETSDSLMTRWRATSNFSAIFFSLVFVFPLGLKTTKHVATILTILIIPCRNPQLILPLSLKQFYVIKKRED